MTDKATDPHDASKALELDFADAPGAVGARGRATPLRILYHHRIAASDGMRVHIAELVGALREAGHIVEVVGPGSDNTTAKADRYGLEGVTDALRALLPAWCFELLELAYNVPAYLRLNRAAAAFQARHLVRALQSVSAGRAQAQAPRRPAYDA